MQGLAGRGPRTARCVAIMPMPPVEPPCTVVRHPLRCNGQGLPEFEYLFGHAHVEAPGIGAPSSAPPGDRPQASGWCAAWLQEQRSGSGEGVVVSSQCVHLQVRPDPAPLRFTGAPFFAESVAAVALAAVRGTLNAHGGRARVHQAPSRTTSGLGGPLLPLWTRGPGLVVGTGVAPPPLAARCLSA